MGRHGYCYCGGHYRESSLTGSITCGLCGKHKPQIVKATEGLVIELWKDGKDRQKIGTTLSIDTLDSWWRKAFSNGYLPSPKYEDEIRVYTQETRQLMKTYRLGWIEVDKLQTLESTVDEGNVIEGKKETIQ